MIDQDDESPRYVSRGAKIQTVFLGIDSLYLVMEYPHADVYKKWSAGIADLKDKRLGEGVPYENMVIRYGALGYTLSVWHGDTRLLITERVNDTLQGTPSEGQGMGIMLQLGAKWLRQYDTFPNSLLFLAYVLDEFRTFGIEHPEMFSIRINRLDIAVDVLGWDISTFSMDEWLHQWVGYATKKTFHGSSKTGKLEGISIGSGLGSVRFRAYDKVAESTTRLNSGFWRSVWGVGDSEEIAVTRFEWTIKCYEARFVNLGYLFGLNFCTFCEALNYVSLRWGRLCVPNSHDTNRSRWELTPMWSELRQMISDYIANYSATAKRDYDLKPDLNPHYIRSVAGWLAGLQARVGIEIKKDSAASLSESLQLLNQHGLSLFHIQRKANQKHKVYSRLSGRK